MDPGGGVRCNMCYIDDSYTVRYGEQIVGYINMFSDGTSSYDHSWGYPWDVEAELTELGLDKEYEHGELASVFERAIRDENRVSGRKRIIYREGPLTLEREPHATGESFSVYRRRAEEGEPDYSPLPHDAPHYEGPHTPEGMREWASWYCFNKMDDGTFEAELDEAWWWGGGHNDGGTIRREIPEEWLDLPYDEFLNQVVRLSAAAHYGFTPEILKSREGLREFFGYSE